jgi:hypothetical protein
MAARYGLPAADLYARLSQGRFRVKASVDHVTAEAYARDLEAIGAHVCIEPVDAPSVGPGVASSLPAPPPAARSGSSLPAQPAGRTTRSSLPAQPAGRTTRSSLPAQPARAGASSLPAQPARAGASSLPAQPARAGASSLPAQPARAGASSLPAQPARAGASSLLAQPARAGASSLPPQPARAGASSLSPDRAGPASQPPRWASAFGPPPASDVPVTALGALDDHRALSLAHLGDEPLGGASAAFAALDPALPTRSGGPPVGEAPPAGVAPPAPDRFSPLAAHGEEPMLQLAAADLGGLARRRVTSPAMAASSMGLTLAPEAAPGPAADRAMLASGSKPAHAAHTAHERRGSSPSLAAPSSATARSRGTAGRDSTAVLPGSGTSHTPAALRPLRDLRVRLAAGVVLAIIVGFVPAHLVAAAREASALAAIDAAVAAAETAVDSPQSYEALEAFRGEQLEVKRRTQRTITLEALAIWAVTGAAVGHAWTRHVPWDRLR